MSRCGMCGMNDCCGADYEERVDTLTKERDQAIAQGSHNLDLRDADAEKYAAIVARVQVLEEALKTYATCSDGCTCGDGWSHDLARWALGETP